MSMKLATVKDQVQGAVNTRWKVMDHHTAEAVDTTNITTTLNSSSDSDSSRGHMRLSWTTMTMTCGNIQRRVNENWGLLFAAVVQYLSRHQIYFFLKVYIENPFLSLFKVPA